MDTGKHFTINSQCRSCGSKSLEIIHRSKPLPVAGIYYNSVDKPLNIKAPMTLAVCKDCTLIQLIETINPDIYNDYNFSGSTLATYSKHLENLSRVLTAKWGLVNKSIFEVGASDGKLLEYLLKHGNNSVVGVEPSAKLCAAAADSGIDLMQGYFSKKFISEKGIGKYDCVIIRHVLEHIDNLNDIAESLVSILKEDGILVVEVPNVEDILRKNLFSNIFHEHLNYFSENSMDYLLSSYGLRKVYSSKVDIHGGSILMIYRLGSTAIQDKSNIDYNLLSDFAHKISKYYLSVNERISSLNKQGKRVHGFGASHRTFVLLGNADLDNSNIPVIYESNPFLQNRYLNGIHSLICPHKELLNQEPDAVVIFASSYENEIINILNGTYGYKKEIISLKGEAFSYES